MSRLKKGDEVWWVTRDGGVVPSRFEHRDGRRCRVSWGGLPGSHSYWSTSFPRRRLYQCREDAENAARVVRRELAEDAGVIELGEGFPNG